MQPAAQQRPAALEPLPTCRGSVQKLVVSGRTKKGIHRRGIHEKVRFHHFLGILYYPFKEIFVEIALIMDTPFVEPLLVLADGSSGALNPVESTEANLATSRPLATETVLEGSLPATDNPAQDQPLDLGRFAPPQFRRGRPKLWSKTLADLKASSSTDAPTAQPQQDPPLQPGPSVAEATAVRKLPEATSPSAQCMVPAKVSFKTRRIGGFALAPVTAEVLLHRASAGQ